MAEKRTLFDRLFGRRPAVRDPLTSMTLINGSASMFSSWNGDPYKAQVVREAIDAAARNGAKLKPRHIRRDTGQITSVGGQIERVLAVRPNPRMSAYDFLYKMITTAMADNNAFAYPEWEGPNLKAVWPVTCSHADFYEDAQGVVYVRFFMPDGKTFVLPYDEVIHIRRHFGRSELVGEDNTPIQTTLGVIDTVLKGLATAVKTSGLLRGILKFSAMLKDSDMKAQRDQFVKDYLDVAVSGGVAATDAKAEYKELTSDPKMVNPLQSKELRDSIYRYFGLNEKIVNSSYNEDEWNAFYESVIEPLAVQLSLEFTAKLFTDRERGFGNEIVFEANRLQYASVKTKLALVAMVDRAALTPNEWREAFNLGPIEGGDKPLRRLDTATVADGNTAPIGNEDQTGKGDGSSGDSQAGDPNSGTEGGQQ